MDWIYIDDVEITDSINTIHCDTRDFCCKLNEEPINTKDRENRDITKCFHKEEYLIESSKIKEFLKGLERMSGGKGYWRLLDFENVNCGNWLKYIRMYRVPNKDVFVVCNRDSEPIFYKNCTKENLKEGYLNFEENE